MCSTKDYFLKHFRYFITRTFQAGVEEPLLEDLFAESMKGYPVPLFARSPDGGPEKGQRGVTGGHQPSGGKFLQKSIEQSKIPMANKSHVKSEEHHKVRQTSGRSH